jgi:tryptophanyl-tRNA synthetase
MDIFSVPRPVVATTRIKSLKNPLCKMSKSDPHQDACIFLTDDPDTVRRKIFRAVTDSSNCIAFDEIDRPGISALITLFALAIDAPVEQVAAMYSSETRFLKFKSDLADVLIEMLSPIRMRYNAIIQDLTGVEKILSEGAEVARIIAHSTLENVKKTIMQ